MKTSTTINSMTSMDVSFKALCITTVLTFLILDLLASGSALAYRNAPNTIDNSDTIRELNVLPGCQPVNSDDEIQLCGSTNLDKFWIKVNHRLQLDAEIDMPSRFQKSPHTELA